MVAKLERLYTIPLGDAYHASRSKRTPRAVKLVRAFITRHMKAKDERVIISEALNKLLWARSIQKPPRRVKVRLVKDDEAVRAYLPDEKPVEPKKAAVGSKAPGAPLSADNREGKKEEPKKEAVPVKKEEKPSEKKEEKASPAPVAPNAPKSEKK